MEKPETMGIDELISARACLLLFRFPKQQLFFLSIVVQNLDWAESLISVFFLTLLCMLTIFFN